jgi:hypothetical protein
MQIQKPQEQVNREQREPNLTQPSFSVRTDKSTYGFGDLVEVSGTLDELVQGKTVRLDVHDPKGNVFQPFNETFSKDSPAFPRLSNTQVKTNDKGLFSYRFPLDQPLSRQFIKGVYEIEATYGGKTRNATFTVR